ncbi:MAG TPA: TetR/AcrR family transcriptional regulator [Rhizomicrobium sp.]|nr:TetR/AcrR family transcriptional regulator [Rhizomicrobium sp.]
MTSGKRNVRRSAVQARSKATVERILEAATNLLCTEGADAVTMTAIAREANVVIGSLYQYFSDKSEIMKAILARHNADVDAMVREGIANLKTVEDFLDAMDRLAEAYFELHRTNPLYKSLWSAVQTDPELQAMDVEDTLQKARLAFAVAKPLYRRVDETELLATCAFVMQTALTAARFALSIPRPLGKRTLSIYQRMSRSLFLELQDKS